MEKDIYIFQIEMILVKIILSKPYDVGDSDTSVPGDDNSFQKIYDDFIEGEESLK